jgi:O-succinylbenzoate synthase
MSDPVHPVAAWAALGRDSELDVQAVELRVVELGFRRPVRTARGEHRRRPVVLVRVTGTGPRGPVEGWGECAALADTTYDSEDVDGAWGNLEGALVPALLQACRTEGRLLGPSELGSVRESAPEARLAFAALEMAVADAHLRAAGVSFAELVGIDPERPVAAGAVVGQATTTAELVDRVGSLVAGGFARVKVKIGPGADLDPVAAVRAAFPELLLQVDANESYLEADTAHLAGLDEFGLLCIEQPFPRDQLAAHARLATHLTTPICLDESLSSPATVAGALEMGACSVVCVKPARLGGIGAALETVRACAATGVPLWIGGMFESSFARQVNAVIASLPGFSWPGDLSWPGGYLTEDLVAWPTTPSAMVKPPAVPGLGPAPDALIVDRLTVRRARLESAATTDSGGW